MLEQAEGPLDGERVPEQLVPRHQHVQRARPVEMQEVDVGDVPLGHPLREVEHEALLHRPAGEAVETAQRDHHEHGDDRQACPGPQRTSVAPPEAAPPAEHEGGRVGGHRASKLVPPGC